MEKVKTVHWHKYLEEVNQHSIWNMHKYLKDEPSDHFISCIPTLCTSSTDEVPSLQTNQSKSELLFDSFFKPHNNPNTTNLAVTTFPEPICEFQNITNKQIHRAIERLSLFKAPGPNGVCNVVFTKNADMLVPHLGHIFRVTFNLKWYPEQWKTLSTIVIQKPGNPNYLLPKVYHAITVLDTI